MIKIPTSITAWNAEVGKRMSITYSEVDEVTGKQISNNKRTDVVVMDKDIKAHIDALLDYAQSVIGE